MLDKDAVFSELQGIFKNFLNFFMAVTSMKETSENWILRNCL